jgi:hypothetical protein
MEYAAVLKRSQHKDNAPQRKETKAAVKETKAAVKETKAAVKTAVHEREDMPKAYYAKKETSTDEDAEEHKPTMSLHDKLKAAQEKMSEAQKWAADPDNQETPWSGGGAHQGSAEQRLLQKAKRMEFQNLRRAARKRATATHRQPKVQHTAAPRSLNELEEEGLNPKEDLQPRRKGRVGESTQDTQYHSRHSHHDVDPAPRDEFSNYFRQEFGGSMNTNAFAKNFLGGGYGEE